MINIKFDLNDISIIPAILSDIDSRNDITLDYLPLIVSPMDHVVDSLNFDTFRKLGFEVCIPRNNTLDINNDIFFSFGLDEIISLLDNKKTLPKKILIDIANGHMKKLYDVAKRIKTDYPDKILMIGNIANPETFRLYAQINVDFVRLSVGSGSVCLTAANGGIYYPMASLIIECYSIKKDINSTTMLVPDGGFNNYSDIIKAIALGADYVMLGSILNKSLESCSTKYTFDGSQYSKITKEEAEANFNFSHPIYSLHRGMSTKEVQKEWNKDVIKTSEGISKYQRVEYRISSWLENFKDYLVSNMSYTGKRDLISYKGKVDYINISENAFRRYNK